MKDITHHFGTLYHPVSALVIYQANKDDNGDTYVEHFDMDENGNPINAHPLSEREAKILAKSLNTEKEKNKAFLKPESILPTYVLYINPTEKGSVIWYTKAKKVKLFFTESLEIPNGVVHTPPMLWMASKQHLTVFALTSDKRPTEKTVLFNRLIMRLKIFPKSNLVENPCLPLLKENKTHFSILSLLMSSRF